MWFFNTRKVFCAWCINMVIRNTPISVKNVFFTFLQFPWFASHNMSSASWFRMMCKPWFHICELTFHFWEMKWDLCSYVSFESKKSQWTWFLNQMQVILIYVMWSLSLLCFDRRTCVGARIQIIWIHRGIERVCECIHHYMCIHMHIL